MLNRLLSQRWMKAVVFVLSLLPALLLAWRYAHHQLGINWVERAEHFTGGWAIKFLVGSLMITPVRKLTGVTALIKYRRQIGLWAFFYGVIHITLYAQYDKGWDWQAIQDDFLTRKFFTAGLIAFALLIPLAATSTTWAIRKLGGKRWQLLHRLVYISAVAAVVHFYLQGKTFKWEPAIYGLIVAVLLIYRLAVAFGSKKPIPAPARAVRT